MYCIVTNILMEKKETRAKATKRGLEFFNDHVAIVPVGAFRGRNFVTSVIGESVVFGKSSYPNDETVCRLSGKSILAVYER